MTFFTFNPNGKRPQVKNTVLTASLSVLLSLSLLGASGCQMMPGLSQQLDPRSKVKVLTVDATVVNQLQYDSVMAQYSKLLKVGENPELLKNPVIQETLKQLTIRKLILTTLIEQEAKKLGLSASNSDIQTLRHEHEAKAGGEEALKSMLEKNQFSESAFSDALKEQVLTNKLVDALAKDSVKPVSLAVTEADAKAFYTKNPEVFKTPPAIAVHHILVKAIDAELRKSLRAANPKWSEDELNTALIAQKATLKTKAADLYGKIKANPALLETLAKTSSDDVLSAKQNGDVGFLTQQTTEPSFWQAASQTAPGALYPGVLETSFGYHILRVDAKKPAGTVDFEKAKSDIIARLGEEKKQQVLATWLKDKESTLKVVIEPAYQPKETDAGKMPPAQPGSAASKAPTAKSAS